MFDRVGWSERLNQAHQPAPLSIRAIRPPGFGRIRVESVDQADQG